MKHKDEHFEQVSFDSIINTVSQANFPKEFPKHWHKYVEVIVVPDEISDKFENYETKAVGVIRMNHKTYELYPGDILFIWPGDLHEIIDNNANGMAAFQFPLTVLSEIQDFAMYCNTFRSYHQLSYTDTPELNQMLHYSLNQIITLANEDGRQFRNVEMLMNLYEMFVSFGRYLFQKTTLTDAQKNGTDKMQMACVYIQENCEADLSLDKVAEYVGFSACYFSRCFKKATSYSFVEYLTIQRVKRMQMLLTNPDINITDAAYQSGFKSISSLNRIFKQYSGCSPSEYRKYYNVNM